MLKILYRLGRAFLPGCRWCSALTYPAIFNRAKLAAGSPGRDLLAALPLREGLKKMPVVVAADALTFTAKMAIRTVGGLAAPLDKAICVLGHENTYTAAGDILTVPRGTQVWGNNYDTFNTNQGTLIALFLAPWVGSEGANRYLYGQTNHPFSVNKYGTAQTFRVYAGSTASPIRVESPSIAAWTIDSLHCLIVRWDVDNPVSGTAYCDLWLDGVQTTGVTSGWDATAPNATASLAGWADGRYTWGGNSIISLTVTDNVISDAECAAIYGGGTFVDPSKALVAPKHMKLYFNVSPWGTSGFTGAQAGFAVNWDQKPYNGTTNTNGNLVVNPGFETALGAEWVVTSGTAERDTTAADLVGFYDTACLKINSAAGPTVGIVIQNITLVNGVDYLLVGTVKKGTAASATVRLNAGVGNNLVLAGTAGGAEHLQGVLNSQTTSGQLQVDIGLTGHPQSGYFDNIGLYRSVVTNGGFEGTYTGGLAGSWTASGATPTENASGRNGKCQHLATTALGGGAYQAVTTVSGTWYAVGGWVKKTSGTGAVGLTLAGAVAVNAALTTSSSWTFVSFIFKATGVSHNIVAYAVDNTVEFDVDDVYCVPLDTDTVTATPASEANSLDAQGFRVDGGDTVTIPALNLLPQPKVLYTAADVAPANFRLSTIDGAAFVDGSAATALQAYRGHLLEINDGTNKALAWIGAAGTAGSVTGTVARENLRLSLVDGTAHAELVGVDLAPYADGTRLLTITDSAGKSVSGYLKAAGTGETLGTEICTDPAFNTGASWTKGTGWAVAGGKATATAANGTNVYIATQGVHTEKLLKLVTTCDSFTAGTYRPLIANIYGYPAVTGTGAKTWYQTITGVAQVYGVNGTTTLTASFTDISYKQVLTPPLTGATVVSASGGSTFNWTSKDADFNPNDATLTYTITGGDTFGADLVSNGADWTGGPPPTGWTGTNATLAAAAGGRTGNCLEITRTGGNYQHGYQTVAGATSGMLVKVLAWNKSGTSGDESALLFYGSSSYISKTWTSGAAWALKSFYGTIDGNQTGSNRIYCYKNSATAGTMLFDDVSTKQVTAPSAAGVKLYSTVALDTQNMAGVHASFNPNAATFTLRVLDVATLQGTIVMKVVPRGWAGALPDGQTHRLLDCTVASTNNRILLQHNTGGSDYAGFHVYDPMGGQKYLTRSPGTEWPDGVPVTIIGRWNAGTVTLRVAGTTVSSPTGTGTGLWTAVGTTAYIGADVSGTSVADVEIVALETYSRALTDAECAAIEAAL